MPNRRPWPALLLLLLLGASTHAFAKPPVFSINDFGAVADGKVDATLAIDRAIEAASAAGGGIVRIPAGKFLTGAIELKSNITLDLDRDAILLMSTNPAHYPVIRTRWEGIECYNYSGLIFARDASNVSISGSGTIDGQGDKWWVWKKSEAPARTRLRELGATTDDPKLRVFGRPKDALRPNLVQFIRCKNVTIQGITLRNSPMWTLHPLDCEGVICRDLTIGGSGPNTDGIDPESCRNVLIEGCKIDTGDDCIAIKSGRDNDGRRTNIHCENIAIRKCELRRGAGGIVIGSETSGGIRNISAADCEISGVGRAIHIKTQRGRGGEISGIEFSKLKLSDIREAAIDLDLEYNTTSAADLGPTTPILKDIILREITCDRARQAIRIRGLAEAPITGLALSDLQFKEADKGIAIRHASKFKIDRLDLTSKTGVPFALEQVDHGAIEFVQIQKTVAGSAVITLKNASDLTLRRTMCPKDAETFISLSGSHTQQIKLIDCDPRGAKMPVEKKADLPADAVITIE